MAAVAAAAIACAPASRPLKLPTVRFRPPAVVRVRVADGASKQTRRVPLEDYVRAVILSEFAPAEGELRDIQRMLQVQAVISRTYSVANLNRHRAEGFDLCATTHCQLYEPSRLRTSRWAAAAADAVRETASAVLWFEGAPARTLFHADCGGRTSDATTIWGGRQRKYLGSIEDDGPADGAHTTWRYEAPRDRVRAALNASTSTRIGTRLDGIDVVARDAAGRAVTVMLRGERRRTVTGEEFRAALTRAWGARTIRSTRFTLERAGLTYVFAGQGFGHGVGLCQAGALARVRAGASPAAVLQRYYPGTALVTMRR